MGKRMSKAYRVVAKTIPSGERKGTTVYTVSPVSYGLLTTEEVSKQISTECTATPADVKAVLDRYAYYVKQHLKKGYDVELLGFGTLTIRFVTSHSVEDPKMANGKLVSSLLPAFRPSYTMYNKTRIYTLIPEKVSLVKYGEEEEDSETKEETPSDITDPSGGSDNTDPSGGSDNTDPSGGSDNTDTGGGSGDDVFVDGDDDSGL